MLFRLVNMYVHVCWYVCACACIFRIFPVNLKLSSCSQDGSTVQFNIESATFTPYTNLTKNRLNVSLVNFQNSQSNHF